MMLKNINLGFELIRQWMSENTLFLLIFVLFLPDYLLYPSMAVLWIFVIWETIHYKLYKPTILYLYVLYLSIVALYFGNYKGFFAAIFIFVLYAYNKSIRRRINPATYMRMQFYIVFSSLFNFFFNFISFRPKYMNFIYDLMSPLIDFGYLPPYGEGYYRAYSTFDNPNLYAFILMIVLLVIMNQLQFQLSFRKYKNALFYLGALIINLYAILITGTRAIIPAVLLGFFVIILIQKKYTQIKVLLLLMYITMFVIASNPSIFPRFMQISDHSNIRLSIWETALFQIKKEPWIGKGLFTYEFLFDRSDAHNIFIETLLSTGIIGTGIFFLYIVEKAKDFYSKAYYLDYPLALSVLVATLFYGIFDIPLFAVQPLMLFVAVLTLPYRDEQKK